VARYCIPDEVVLQEVGDEAVLLNLSDGVYFTLDDVGVKMVRLFRQHGDVARAVQEIAAEYEAVPARIHADMVTLLDEMVSHGLARRVD
jgi:hypothetical protein